MILYLDPDTTVEYRCYRRGELNDKLRQPAMMPVGDVDWSTENGTLVVDVRLPSTDEHEIGHQVRRDRHGRAFAEVAGIGLVNVAGLSYDAYRDGQLWSVNVLSDGQDGLPGWHRIGRVRASETDLPAAIARAVADGWPHPG